MSAQFTMTLFDGQDNAVEVCVDYDAFYQPAKISGPPENCYPEESEMTINSVTTKDGADYPVTEEQEEAAWEHYNEDWDRG